MATTTTDDRVEQVRATAKQAFGFVPNLIDEMASHNPAVAETYLTANGAIENGVLSPAEQQVVILAISTYNDCHYCTKAHAAAGAQAGLPRDEIDSLLEGGVPENDRHRQLVRVTRRIAGKRGWLNDADLGEFEDVGLGRDVLYEVVTLIGIKTISNYINHIAHTEVDPAFQ
jgi:AhpD family alkylhydroperoxidase